MMVDGDIDGHNDDDDDVLAVLSTLLHYSCLTQWPLLSLDHYSVLLFLFCDCLLVNIWTASDLFSRIIP